MTYKKTTEKKSSRAFGSAAKPTRMSDRKPTTARPKIKPKKK